MSEHTAYPLSWPTGWPKTEPMRREGAKFKTTLPAALANLQRQIGLMGGKNIILSSNYTLGSANPKEPGVVAYFEWQSLKMAIPCDRWFRIEHNVQAIALTVEAMRGMERWGAKHMIKAMFTGFKALPEKASGIDPMAVLGIETAHGQPITEQIITDAFRRRCKTEHPDVATGSEDKFRILREAHDLAMATVRK